MKHINNSGSFFNEKYLTMAQGCIIVKPPAMKTHPI